MANACHAVPPLFESPFIARIVPTTASACSPPSFPPPAAFARSHLKLFHVASLFRPPACSLFLPSHAIVVSVHWSYRHQPPLLTILAASSRLLSLSPATPCCSSIFPPLLITAGCQVPERFVFHLSTHLDSDSCPIDLGGDRLLPKWPLQVHSGPHKRWA